MLKVRFLLQKVTSEMELSGSVQNFFSVLSVKFRSDLMFFCRFFHANMLREFVSMSTAAYVNRNLHVSPFSAMHASLSIPTVLNHQRLAFTSTTKTFLGFYLIKQRLREKKIFALALLFGSLQRQDKKMGEKT